MKRYIFLIISILLATNVFSQTYVDAIRFSQQNYEGTARFASMAGAFGALGGDFTALSLNPAGIGVYRSSEFTITPMVTYNQVKSDYINSTIKDSRTRFHLSNIGYITSFLSGNENGLASFNLGIGYNQVTNFHRNSRINASNLETSMIDFFTEKANKATSAPNNWEEDGYWDIMLAYDTYLFNDNPITGLYETELVFGDRVNQTRFSEESGYIGEYIFSFGGNVANKFYFGATIGVHDLQYDNVIHYAENGVPSNTSDFKYFDYYEYFETSGTGYNFKFGAIYRPTPELRIGAAFHTPTYYDLTDTYYADMQSQIDNRTYNSNTPTNVYDYRLQSPLRAMGSVAYTFNKIGLLSVDYEFINYSGTRMKHSDHGGGFEEDNAIIKKYYRGTSNIRIGGEAWFDRIAVRAGFAYNQSPDKDFDISRYTYSAGLGYKYKNFFADFAYAITSSKDYYTPYLGSPYNVTERETKNKFLLTLGFRF